ncbi:MAG: ABC transporter permease [Candidatus Brocadiae bacterium]|nr:ABC transporter permease [Candidatus Brocadiia bacterium]
MMKFLQEYGGEILELSADHMLLTGVAMLIACTVAVPLGIVLTRLRSRRLASAILGVVNIVQPIPSLALVALAAVLFLSLGLPTIGILPGLLALVAYALLPILRNTYTGIRQVDPTVVEVAVGMGMTRRQVLVSVELPLALPVIMAGIRIATVWTIGVATLVSLIGAESLGKPIFRGLSRGRIELILAGALPAVAMALLFDWLLGRVEKWFTPTGLEASRTRVA